MAFLLTTGGGVFCWTTQSNQHNPDRTVHIRQDANWPWFAETEATKMTREDHRTTFERERRRYRALAPPVSP